MESFNNNNICENNNNNNNLNMLDQRSGVEELTNRLNQMNVDINNIDMLDAQQQQQAYQEQQNSTNIYNQQESQQQQDMNFTSDYNTDFYGNRNRSIDDGVIDDNYYNTCRALMEQDESFAINQQQQQRFQQINNNQQQQNMSSILIVTNVDRSIFTDIQMKSNFESLFLPFDNNITFRYLKSFRRVRVDFTDPYKAEQARLKLNNYPLGDTEFKCYAAQIIKPNYLTPMGNRKNNFGDGDEDFEDSDSSRENSIYLNIPKLTKQFLISPPASPPVGWKPCEEQSPCIDVQLLSAIVNLCPGKVHEIHAGNESQPGIFVEVCEEPKFDRPSGKTCSRIPKTMSPASFCRQANMSG